MVWARVVIVVLLYRCGRPHRHFRSAFALPRIHRWLRNDLGASHINGASCWLLAATLRRPRPSDRCRWALLREHRLELRTVIAIVIVIVLGDLGVCARTLITRSRSSLRSPNSTGLFRLGRSSTRPAASDPILEAKAAPLGDLTHLLDDKTPRFIGVQPARAELAPSVASPQLGHCQGAVHKRRTPYSTSSRKDLMAQPDAT